MQAQMIVLVALVFACGRLLAQQDRIAPGGASQPPEPSNYPSQFTFTPQPWQQCLRELCGEELNRLNREITQYAQTHADRHGRDFMPLIQAAIAAGREELVAEKLSLENLVQAVRQDRDLSTPHALQMYEISSSLENNKEVVLNADGTLDVVGTREAMKGKPEEAVARSLKGWTVVMEAFQKYPAVAKESFAVLRQRLTDQEIRKQISETVTIIDKNENALAQHFGLPREALFPGVRRWEEFKKRLTSDQLDSYDVEQIADRYKTPALLTALMAAFPLSDKRSPVKVYSVVPPQLLKEIEERLQQVTEYLAGRSPTGGKVE